MTHWHAYGWAGHERPDDKLRADLTSEYPPLEVANWLVKPARMIVGTHRDAESGLEWLRGVLKDYPHHASSFTPEERLEYAAEHLARGDDVVWGYYSGQRYVARVLIACPKTGMACPRP